MNPTNQPDAEPNSMELPSYPIPNDGNGGPDLTDTLRKITAKPDAAKEGTPLSTTIRGDIIAAKAALLRLFKGEYRESSDRHSDALLSQEMIDLLYEGSLSDRHQLEQARMEADECAKTIKALYDKQRASDAAHAAVVEEARSQVSQLQRELGEAKREIEFFTKDKANLEAAFVSKEERAHKAEERAAKAEVALVFQGKELASAKYDLPMLHTTIYSLRTLVSSQKGQIERGEARITHLEDTNAKYAARICELQTLADTRLNEVIACKEHEAKEREVKEQLRTALSQAKAREEELLSGGMRGQLTRVGTFPIRDEETTGFVVSCHPEALAAIQHIPMYRDVVIVELDTATQGTKKGGATS